MLPRKITSQKWDHINDGGYQLDQSDHEQKADAAKNDRVQWRWQPGKQKLKNIKEHGKHPDCVTILKT